MLYILTGPDGFSLSQALEEIRSGLGDPAALATCTTVLDGQKVSSDELKHICETVPFLSEKRLVIIRGLIGRLEARARPGRSGAGRAAQQDHGEFSACLAQIPETTVVVMTEDEIPNNSRLLGELSPRAIYRTFPLLKEAALRPWVQNQTMQSGGSISAQAVNLLCQLVGSNLWTMSNEIDKLVLYANGRRIEEADVKSLVGYTQDTSVFALIDAIVDFRAEQAGQLLQQLLRHGAAPAYLLFMLDRQFRMIIIAKELREKRRPEPAIQAKLGLFSEYALRRTLEQAGRYSLPRLKQIYRQLLEADLAMKTGRYDSELALDLLVADLCQRTAIQRAVTT